MSEVAHKSMTASWRFYSFWVSPPAGAGQFAGKKREVEVFAPTFDAARFGVGNAEDENVVENRLADSDRAFRSSMAVKKASSDELVVLFVGLERALNLGVPVRKGLETIVPLCRTPFFRGVLGAVYQKMGEGESFSMTLKLFPEVFDKSTVSLIEAGEKMGDLRPIFKDLAAVATRSNSLMKKLKGGMVYPAIIGSMTIAAVLILGWKVVPEMAKTYKSMGIKLPMITTIIVYISETLMAKPYLLLVPIIAVYLMWSIRDKILAHPFVERKLLDIPVIGPVLRGAVLVRCLRSLGLLLQAGVTNRDAFSIVADAANNRVYEEYFRSIGIRAVNGENLPGAFLRERARIPVDGYIIANYVKLGMFVQDIPGMIKKYSDQLDDDVQQKAEALPRVLEPFLMMFLTGVVGGVISAVYLPYFTLLLEIMKKSH